MALALQCGQFGALLQGAIAVRGSVNWQCLSRSQITLSISSQLTKRLHHNHIGPRGRPTRNRTGLRFRCAASYSGAASPQRVTHTVEPGESLYHIASTYGVTVDELLLENPQVEDITRLRPGMILTVDDGHQRFSRQDIHKAAGRGGLGDSVHKLSKGVQSRADHLVESVRVRLPSRHIDASLPFSQSVLVALVLGALLVLDIATRLFAKPEPEAVVPEVVQAAPYDEEKFFSLLRSARVKIEKLESELEGQEERWQAMLVRARKDHEESQLLKERVGLLEKALEDAQEGGKGDSPPARRSPAWSNKDKK